MPANLGQVTYKTSLLHLQPRQMTLVMTELRDDFPIGPDPTFNPNLFSEDEEDLLSDDKNRARKVSIDNSPPIAPMSPRGNRLNRPKPQVTNNYLTTTESRPIPALAKAESYEDEFPYVDLGDVANYKETIRPHTLTNGPTFNQSNLRTANSSQSTSFVGQFNRNTSSTTTNQRHAISPLCCEGSVPALQSPKNAVAPSDIIFDRPPAQTLISYSTADYCNNSNIQQVKANIINERNGISLGEQHKPFIMKKVDANGESNKLSNETKSTNVKKTSSNGKEILFIDDEMADVPGTSSGKQNLPNQDITDSMVRSCSVGYLDLVDAQVIPSEVALMMLRKDAPKRLVLVNNKIKNNKKTGRRRDNKNLTKSPKLRNCRKSKSLDSSDMFTGNEPSPVKKEPKEEIIPEIVIDNGPEINRVNTTALQNENNLNNNINNNINKKDSRLNFFTSKSPLMKRKKDNNTLNNTIDNNCQNKSRGRSKKSNIKSGLDETSSTNITNSKTGMFLHNHALATLENLITRLRDDDNKTPPASPRLPRSSPASPAPSKKGKRPQSASPIRKNLLSSPLLGRRNRKNKTQESSDDEVTASGDEVCNGINYKDLETFQKAQLRQKVRALFFLNSFIKYKIYLTQIFS